MTCHYQSGFEPIPHRRISLQNDLRGELRELAMLLCGAPTNVGEVLF
jgi:hypothetical protein